MFALLFVYAQFALKSNHIDTKSYIIHTVCWYLNRSLLFVYLEKEHLVSGAGKIEGWHKRNMKRKEFEDGSRIERKVSPRTCRL